MYEELKTLVEVIYNAQKNSGDKDFLKYRVDEKFVSITYNQFVEMMEVFAASLYDIGVRKGDKVGIISENIYKWLITDMAIISLGAVDVPRGSDSTSIEISYILEHSDAKYCFVENPEQADKILSIKKEIPKIKCLILFTGTKSEIKGKIPKDIQIFHFDDLLKKGYTLINKYKNKLKSIRDSIKYEDIVTIIYTSGTTGTPKGVMLTHKNILHNVRSLPDVIHITTNERWLSILPVWHVFERTLEYIIMATSGTMGYSKPTARYLLPAFAEIKPTFMVSVPRIWEALYQGIVSKVKGESKIKWAMFSFFVKIGISYKKAWKTLKGLMPLFDKPFFLVSFFKKVGAFFVILFLWFWNLLGNILVFSNIKAKTGGCLRGPVSGGGALPEYVDNFFCAVGIEILEGWGLTETAPVIGVRLFERLVPRTVGPAAPGVEIMIGDEKGRPLFNQHEKGIVYIRGDNVMAGYYKDPKKTKAVISKDGWFNTGDLGRMTITGELQLTGRAKDTIVLIGGENIEPSPIEDKLLEDPMIYQAMVVGQDKKILGALIVPAEENIFEYASINEISYKSIDDLCKNPNIIDEYKKNIKSKINPKNGFRDYERIIFFKLIPKPFEVGEELTHSLKMKRNVIADKYKKVIEEIFG